MFACIIHTYVLSTNLQFSEIHIDSYIGQNNLQRSPWTKIPPLPPKGKGYSRYLPHNNVCGFVFLGSDD